MSSNARRLRSCSRRLSRDLSGSVAIASAFMFPLIIGSVGLGVETGYWYVSQRQLQHVADVSAHAGALRKKAGDSATAYTEAARYLASKSGFAGPSSAILVNTPPSTGAFTAKTDAVEVIISENLPRYFTSFFTRDPLTIEARAVARVDGNPTCVLALATTGSGAFHVGGSTELNLPTCDIVSNSTHANSFQMQGAAARITAACVYSAGGVSANSNLGLEVCEAAEENAAPVADPYADVTQPAVTGVCANGNVSNTTLTPTEAHASGVSSKRFCSGLSISGAVHLDPGLYIIGGGNLSGSNGATLTGSGVTLFFTNGARVSLSNSTTQTLSAPTSGPFSGILMFGDRNDPNLSHTARGSGSSSYQGAIYFPAGHMDYRGNSASTNGCTQLIAKTIDFGGNSSFSSSCDAAGTRSIRAGRYITVVE